MFSWLKKIVDFVVPLEPALEEPEDEKKLENKKFFTSGGRVLAVNAVAENLDLAREKAYQAVSFIKFENMRFRSDIGAN